MSDSFYKCVVQNSSHYPHVATRHLHVATVTEELNFKFYLIKLNLNSLMWPVATGLDSIGLSTEKIKKKNYIWPN